MEPDKVMDFLLEMKPIVVEAGRKYVKPRFSGAAYQIDFEANPDDPANYVTAADKHISRIVLERAREIFPGSYSEEHFKAVNRRYGGPLSVWDPIDGTGGYVEELYESCGTLGAVIDENNEPVGGISYAPETEALTIATKWEGPFCEIDGVPQKVTEPAGYIIAVQRTEAPNSKFEKFLEWFGKKRCIPVQIIEGGGPGSFGAAAFKYPYNMFPNTVGLGNWKEWDKAALQVILEKSGWDVTDLRGNRLTYNNYHPQYYNGLLSTRLEHLGLTQRHVVDDLVEFTELYGSELKLPGHEATDGTVLITDRVYTDFKQSDRLREWKEAIKTVPNSERHKLLKRKILVEVFGWSDFYAAGAPVAKLSS